MQITPFVLPVAPAAVPALPAVAGFAGHVDMAVQAEALMPDLDEAGDGAAFDAPPSGQGAVLPGPRGGRLGHLLAMPEADMQRAAGQAVDGTMVGEAGAAGTLPPDAPQPALANDEGDNNLHADSAGQLTAVPEIRVAKADPADNDMADPAELAAASMPVPAPVPAASVPVSVAPPAVAPGVLARGPGATKAAVTAPVSNDEQPAFADGGATTIAGRIFAGAKAQPDAAPGSFASKMAAGDGLDGKAGTGEPVLSAPGRQDAAPSTFHSAMASSGAGGAGDALPLRHAAAPVPPHEPTIAARPGHFGQSLGIEIARRVELGGESLRVRLNPAELGHVEVTLAFDEGGALRATVRAQSGYALELLRQEAPELARTLEQAGVQADAQSLRFESRGGGGSSDHQAQPRHANQHEPAADDEAGNAAPVWRAARGDGQVDLIA